jgi:hypothetical protein
MDDTETLPSVSSDTSETKPVDTDKKPHNYTPKKTNSYVNKNVNSEQLELEKLSHEQLLVEAKRLQRHLFQLKNILRKTTRNQDLTNPKRRNIEDDEDDNDNDNQYVKENDNEDNKDDTTGSQDNAADLSFLNDTKKKTWKNHRPFDFSKFNKRHVLLKFAYLGWNYHVQ